MFVRSEIERNEDVSVWGCVREKIGLRERQSLEQRLSEKERDYRSKTLLLG